jgi:hypothetical protein
MKKLTIVFWLASIGVAISEANIYMAATFCVILFLSINAMCNIRVYNTIKPTGVGVFYNFNFIPFVSIYYLDGVWAINIGWLHICVQLSDANI